ncbi:MAG: hypothetical protein ACI8VC_002468 [Candidatus Endobugula sp.]|jgi:hypothetical protein
MIKYLLKWLVASLIMPILVMIFGRVLNLMLVLMFWPSGMFLMSLGAEERPWSDILYVWGVAVGVNVLLYVSLGLIIYYVIRFFKKQKN